MEMTMTGYARLAVLTVAALLLGGCESSPTAEQERNAVPVPSAQYAGLQGQSVAVMVWVDWSVRTDYPKIQLDLARLTQERLESLYPPPLEGAAEPKEAPKKEASKKESKKKDKDDELPPTTYINPASVVRFQREHPEIEGQPIVRVAPRLGVTRVVYVEVERFEAQSPQSIMLLKGMAKATLRVAEVNAEGQAAVAFEEQDIEVQFPPGTQEGIIPDQKKDIRWVYTGTVERLAEALGVRFAQSGK